MSQLHVALVLLGVILVWFLLFRRYLEREFDSNAPKEPVRVHDQYGSRTITPSPGDSRTAVNSILLLVCGFSGLMFLFFLSIGLDSVPLLVACMFFLLCLLLGMTLIPRVRAPEEEAKRDGPENDPPPEVYEPLSRSLEEAQDWEGNWTD